MSIDFCWFHQTMPFDVEFFYSYVGRSGQTYQTNSGRLHVLSNLSRISVISSTRIKIKG